MVIPTFRRLSKSPADRMALRGERGALIQLAKECAPKRVLEIGIYEGATTVNLLRECDTIESYFGVDMLCPPAINDKQPSPPGRLVNDKRFHLLLPDNGSRDLHAGEIQADLVFIDGDHSFNGCMWDSLLAIHANPRMIIWHDYYPPRTLFIKNLLQGRNPINGVGWCLDVLSLQMRLRWILGTSMVYWRRRNDLPS